MFEFSVSSVSHTREDFSQNDEVLVTLPTTPASYELYSLWTCWTINSIYNDKKEIHKNENLFPHHKLASSCFSHINPAGAIMWFANYKIKHNEAHSKDTEETLLWRYSPGQQTFLLMSEYEAVCAAVGGFYLSYYPGGNSDAEPRSSEDCQSSGASVYSHI